MGAQLRKYQNMLIIIGTGVIYFGVWGYVKLAMYFVSNRSNLLETFSKTMDVETLTPEILQVFYIITFAMILLMGGIIFAVRLYVGLSARAEGMGRRHGVFYLVVAVLIVLIEGGILVASVVLYFSGNGGETSFLDMLATAVVELTSVVLTAEMVVSAVKVKRLEKQMKG